MAFLDQEFELTRDNEMEEIIAELPIPLVLENIRDAVANVTCFASLLVP